MDQAELKRLLIDVLDEEFTPNPVPIAKRWSGGSLILKPDNDTQAKEIPIEVFFRKIIGVRESLRVLEQKLNNHDSLSAEDKMTFASYLTKCYGSLTTFNILFKEDKDKFIGAGTMGSKSNDHEKKAPMKLGEMRKKLGLNEYGDR